MKVLVTGGAGFIGSNFVRRWLARHPQDSVVVLDRLTYAGNLENLEGLDAYPGYRFVRGDVAESADVRRCLEPVPDLVVHFAAESHVDRSIDSPRIFLHTNVVGTQTLLEGCREASVPRFVQVSTDEVYGSLGPTGAFSETTPLAPNSPYSASKAGADLIVRSYVETYGFPALVTRCSNNYGPFQFPEKLIPLLVTRALADQPLPIYGDGLNVRDWLHVEDHCDAIEAVCRRGEVGRVYNIGGECEKTNIEIAEAVLGLLGKPRDRITFVKDRPGHDRRYAMDISRIRGELGWTPRWRFEEGLAATVDWYRSNAGWWQRILDGSYRQRNERGASS